MPPYPVETAGSASKATLLTPATATTLPLMASTATKVSSSVRIWTPVELQRATKIYCISAPQTSGPILSSVHGCDTTYGRSLYPTKRCGPTGSTRTMTTSASATTTPQTTLSLASALSTRQLCYSTSALLYKTTLLLSSKKTVRAS